MLLAGRRRYIYNGSKNGNFGSAVDMGVGEDNNANNRFARSLIKFDLSPFRPMQRLTRRLFRLQPTRISRDNTRTIRVYQFENPVQRNASDLEPRGNRNQLAERGSVRRK